eukprot:Mrub_08774.p1 GENE.Mrub_08774~~Mrub_08774.p1  ORF type:complete len:251 (+),score=102.25 Mrub_08774:94-753(+)
MQQTMQNMQTVNNVVTAGTKVTNFVGNEVRNAEVAKTGLNEKQTGHVGSDIKNLAESFVRNYHVFDTYRFWVYACTSGVMLVLAGCSLWFQVVAFQWKAVSDICTVVNALFIALLNLVSILLQDNEAVQKFCLDYFGIMQYPFGRISGFTLGFMLLEYDANKTWIKVFAYIMIIMCIILLLLEIYKSIRDCCSGGNNNEDNNKKNNDVNYFKYKIKDQL